ncbi:MAG: polyphenol oxidase family protein [Bacteroidales bacterium]|nr:polyphenol oxidase family protein [Bacteroidales bacterium]
MLTFTNNCGLLKFEILEQYAGVVNFVTTRRRPDGLDDNFNIGFSGGKADDIVVNRELLSLAVGIPGNRFVFQNQVHGNSVHVCTSADGGAGWFSKDTAIQNTDILVTNERNLCLVTRSADCVPVLLYSPDSQSIAAVHSGREGTYLKAAVVAAQELCSRYGAIAKNIVACIGPAIGFSCYEVGMDCADKFLRDPRFHPDTIRVTGEKAFLDLKKMIFYDLLTFGLVANNIEISDICTKCSDSAFFSARRGENQRFCAGICLK